MKCTKKSLKVLFILLLAYILLSNCTNINVYAKGKAPKWTATATSQNYTYTGKKIKPKITVKYQGKKLKPKNYKLTYPKTSVNPGTYKVKVTLKGKYKGKKLHGKKYIKYNVIIPQVQNLNYTRFENYLYFTWSQSNNITGYNVEVSNNGTLDTETKKDTKKSNCNFYSIKMSEYGVDYTCRVRSYKKIGQKTYYSKWTTKTIAIPFPDYQMTTKTVNGISIAYNYNSFPFFKYTADTKAKKNFAQSYFPIFIKQRLNNDFVIHTQYNGNCGFNNFSNTQYIPNRKDAEVVTDIDVTYYDEMPKDDEMQQTLYKQGYIGYILINVSCLLDQQQSVDVYFGDEKVITLVSNGFSASTQYDYMKYYRYDPFLKPAYNYSTDTKLKDILNDVAKCSPDMTDFEKYTALNYWISCHSYSEYTCWGAATVAEAMTMLGYSYIPLYCSYQDDSGNIYNNYTRYYSPRSKQTHYPYGHMITLIYMQQGKFLYCEVQGWADSSSEFVFNPEGWNRPNYNMEDVLHSVSDKFSLNEYQTINELMSNDYNVDIYKYDPFDWHTWKNDLN